MKHKKCIEREERRKRRGNSRRWKSGKMRRAEIKSLINVRFKSKYITEMQALMKLSKEREEEEKELTRERERRYVKRA